MNAGAIGARVERLHDWFALQIALRRGAGARTNCRSRRAVTFNTNLHRRFGFGRPANEGWSPDWNGYVQRLAAIQTRTERIEYTKAFARERFVPWAGSSERQFGCFSFEVQSGGVIRLHFSPNDTEDGSGPLARGKYQRRIDELTGMFAFVRQQCGDGATDVVGGSWLYHLDAYKRLFPAEYVASLRIHTAPSNFAGGSWWGQFVDHREDVVTARAAEFSDNLRRLDPAAAWKVFPFPAMTARAPVRVFHQRYGT